MHNLKANKTTIRGMAQIGIQTRQTRQGVEGDTINTHENGRGESRFGVELHPVNIMIV
jgi:hypothetical protein